MLSCAAAQGGLWQMLQAKANILEALQTVPGSLALH